MVREWGRVVVVGAYEAPVTVDLTGLFAKQVTIQGSYAHDIPDDVHEALELIRDRKVDRNALITQEFPLDQAKEAYDTQDKAGKSVKVIFKT